ncbi:hypothetical protein [Azorhizobium doebereinerae]|uniref:hypothetical protein n=1 Tax=Azorhizobium doebereinerae TaxID=281091 RepID=UPI0012EC952A|nr:hypothetical protein [Azorhizobium doebereinerae]
MSAINQAGTQAQLDHRMREIWTAHGAERLSDDDAQSLAECVAKRRPLRNGGLQASPIKAVAGRLGSIFKPRQRPRSPDRQASRERRRNLGGSGALPAPLRSLYTEGQRAVLFIVAGEVDRHGRCDLPIDQIAALAGVGRTTVQTAMHEARRLQHIRITVRPQSGRKNLPNVVEIISPEWLLWLKRGAKARRAIGSNSLIPSKKVNPTKNMHQEKSGIKVRHPYQGACEEDRMGGRSFPVQWGWRPVSSRG